MSAAPNVASGAAAHDDGPRAVVIGGGFAGLATAGLLARDGHRVTLLERNTGLGGRSGDRKSVV